MAKERDDIVGLSADLSKYTDLHIFAKENPDKFFQMGMAEQLLMSAAAGLAREGFVPFATTYAVFASRRAYDFICMAIAEDNLNVKIVAALPGLTTGYGPSHQATDDIAIFRAMPNLMVIDPCDALEIEQAIPQIAAHNGPVYMRLLRGQVPLVLDKYNYQFKLGKAQVIKPGKDLLIISTGLLTMRALEAAEELEKEGISAEVIDLRTIRPLDWMTIFESVKKTNRLVIVEEQWPFASVSSEITYRIQKEAFDYLDAPIRRITAADAPMHYAPNLVAAYLPDVARTVKLVKEVMYIQK